ncbi:site-2 protease family protein [Fulvivirgaceae bacterium BMA10]|uniref:Zinc metalloprotease n=1 Tax=Splendidivirga corallicola TaxID=3051826 RepID=A0ABT8KXZ0_9BACT|nr:site-2 protease family protein [Fulvivirgaceae bacterium BMA10]
MKWSLYLGSYAGIKVFIHWTFVILLGWIGLTGIYAGDDLLTILWQLLFIICIFLCVTLHEFGHALMAKKFKFKTKDITLLPIGGLARLERMPEKPNQELKVAIAGPIVNVIIAMILAIPLGLGGNMPGIESISKINAGNFVFMLAVVNVILAVFNLIPAFPMDGGRIFRALLAYKYARPVATKIAASFGQFIAILFVFLGLFSNPFLVLIGIFIYLGAQAESNYVQIKDDLHGYYVRDVIMHRFDRLRIDDHLSVAVSIILDSQVKDFLVMDGENVVGTLSREDVIKALRENGQDPFIGDIMNKKLIILDPDTPLEKLYEKKQGQKQALMPVIKDHQLLGVLDLENVMEFMTVKNALQNRKDPLYV